MSSDYARENASETVWHILRSGMTRSCVGCFNFDREVGVCNLVAQRPPVEVIVKGCERFDLAVPF